MKHRFFVSISIAATTIAVFITSITGCAGVEEPMIANIMREMPEDTVHFNFWDIEALRADSDLVNAYQGWQYNYQYTLDDYGIVTDNVNRTALGMLAEDAGYYLVYGDFDLNERRATRDSLGFNSDSYLDIEVWRRTGELVALMDGLIITGTEQSIKDCIDVIKQNKDSLWDSQDVRDVVNMLPCGFNTRYVSESGMMSYEGERAYGISVEKKDEATLKITQVYLFKDEAAAQIGLGEIEDDVEKEAFEHFEYTEIKQDGKFVIATVEVDIDLMYR